MISARFIGFFLCFWLLSNLSALKHVKLAIGFAILSHYHKSQFRYVFKQYRVTLFKLHIHSFYIVTHVQSVLLSRSCRFPHRLKLPIQSLVSHSHLIFFCCFLYRQSLPIRLCERYSESQPIRPCQLQVKLTGMFGWLFGA